MTEPETDNNADDGDKETKPQQEPPRRAITLSAREQTVVVEGPDSLEEIAKLVAYLWRLIEPAKTVRAGFESGSTLITERSEPWSDSTDQGRRQGQQHQTSGGDHT